MRQEAAPIFCAAILIGCASASPSFVKLDASGKKDLSASPETLQIDLADCKVLEANVRAEASDAMWTFIAVVGCALAGIIVWVGFVLL